MDFCDGSIQFLRCTKDRCLDLFKKQCKLRTLKTDFRHELLFKINFASLQFVRKLQEFNDYKEIQAKNAVLLLKIIQLSNNFYILFIKN